MSLLPPGALAGRFFWAQEMKKGRLMPNPSSVWDQSAASAGENFG
jgi:hypothetical protein